jgi:hypothetical protein
VLVDSEVLVVLTHEIQAGAVAESIDEALDGEVAAVEAVLAVARADELLVTWTGASERRASEDGALYLIQLAFSVRHLYPLTGL